MCEKEIHPVAMTVAGSDSSGGAGIQADLRAFRWFDVYGASAISCITAQNPNEVRSVFPLPVEEIALQMETVLDGLFVKTIKTGMLYSAEIIEKVVAVLDTYSEKGITPALIVDPVMISTSGVSLIDDNAVAVMKNKLFPLATLVTPNIPEAEVLSGITISTMDDMHRAGKELAVKYNCAFLIKGGHAVGEKSVDLLFSYDEVREFSSERVMNTLSTHGTGCSLSSGIAACLANGYDLDSAVTLAKEYVVIAIKNSCRIGEDSYGMWPE